MKPRGMKLRRCVNAVMRVFSLASTALALGMMGWILCQIIREGVPELSWELLMNRSKPFGELHGGIANALLGTVAITAGASALAVPLAILAGIGLSEFGGRGRFTAVCRFTINLMMGVPSVIVGLFVYGIFVVTTGHFSGFAGSIALALLMFAVIVRTTEDQLSLVSMQLRESALALGITRTRATIQIVMRAARQGMITGIMLAVARVSGETAPLLFTSLFADSWPTGYFTGPTASAPVLITNYTMDSPFEQMQRIGWGAALIVAGGILALNLIVRICAERRKDV